MIYKKAYATLKIKSIDDEKRIIEGIATTPATDFNNDIVEPLGAQFNLPIPFLWQHDLSQPIGEVIKADVSNTGIKVTIQIANIQEDSDLKTRIDQAWIAIKNKLIKGLSVGFKAIESQKRENSNGIHFLVWKWYELSAVTIPANSEATITTIKQLFNDPLTDVSANKQINAHQNNKHLTVNLTTSKHVTVKLN